MKAQEADEENEKLKRDLREKQKAIEDMKKQVEEKKKQAQARASAALSTPKLPKFAHSQSSRPNLVPTSSLNKGLHPLQTKGSKRPVLKTDVHKEKLGNFGSHLTPRSNKSAPEALARTPSKSPSLSDFRKSRDSKLKPAQKNHTFDLDSSNSSDDKETGILSTQRAALTTPRREKRQSAPTTPSNSRKQQPPVMQAGACFYDMVPSTRTVQNNCSRAIEQERFDTSTQIIFWPGPRLSLNLGKNQDQRSTVTSSSRVVGMSDSAMDTSE